MAVIEGNLLSVTAVAMGKTGRRSNSQEEPEHTAAGVGHRVNLFIPSLCLLFVDGQPSCNASSPENREAEVCLAGSRPFYGCLCKDRSSVSRSVR